MYVGEEDIWEYTFGEGTDKPPTGIIMKQQFIRQYYYNQSPLEVSLLIDYFTNYVSILYTIVW